MNKKQQNQDSKKIDTLNLNIKNIGLNLDKMEYQQIVLSDSNFPEKSYFRKNDYD